MNASQRTHLNMYMAVRDYIGKNIQITAKLPNFSDLYTSFQDNILKISENAEEQDLDRSGITINMENLKNSLIDIAYDISRKMVAYSKITNNVVLLKEIEFVKSDFTKANNLKLTELCQTIYSRANNNLKDLELYLINASSLSTFKKNIDTFKAAIPSARIGTIDRKNATSQLLDIFKSLEVILDKLDALVDIIRLPEPEFYTGYYDIRKLKQTPTTSISLKGNAIEFSTKEPVKGVDFLFSIADKMIKSDTINNSVVVKKKTSPKGNFIVKNIAEGSYSVYISKSGYKPQTISININKGEMTTIKVEMEKES